MEKQIEIEYALKYNANSMNNWLTIFEYVLFSHVCIISASKY